VVERRRGRNAAGPAVVNYCTPLTLFHHAWRELTAACAILPARGRAPSLYH